jgi:tyrosyl-tRNA synthetase
VTPTPVSASDEDTAAEAAALARDAVDSLPVGGLERKCAQARADRRPLRVKLGIDPTAPDIHLGHAVVLRKLREFQDAGHRVVLIVGDTTAQVGDPSGRSELRPLLNAEAIERNAQSYQEQALRILRGDAERLEVRRNSEWLDLDLAAMLQLLATTTVAQLVERDDFAKRMAAGHPLSMLEMIYPLLQGYDSVAVRADVELGGTDQKFNLLMGRDIQRAYGQEGQAIMTMPILVGTDGERKMSKSLGNEIGVSDEPEEMYGKTMSLPDEAMDSYFRLLLGRPAPGELAPRDAKRELARGLVAWLHSEQDAERAEQAFDRVFVARQAPQEMPEVHLDGDVLQAPGARSGAPGAAGEAASAHMPAVIAKAFGVSRSEARRLLGEGAVSLDGERVVPDALDLPLEALDGRVLQVGRRRFARLRA